jgi:hypothetical protein
MNRSTTDAPEVTIGPEVIDPVLIANIRATKERFCKNMAWFEAHAVEIGKNHPGRYICVAGEELFVGDDPTNLFARVRAAHPDDWGGVFTKFIPARTNA